MKKKNVVNKKFYENELSDHLGYYRSLIKEMDFLSEESTELVKSLIESKEKGEELSPDKFVTIDYNNFKANSISVDMTKCETRIRQIVSYAVNEGYDIVSGFSGYDANVLHGLLYGNKNAPTFLFVKDGEHLKFSSDELESIVREDAERRIKSMELDSILETYKRQYDAYMKNLNSHG